MLPLVAYTLHAQFPTAAFLVVTRSADEDDYDELSLDSVRDADGGIVWEFAQDGRGTDPLPAVPEDIAALWGSYDPQDPDVLLELLQRVKDTAPYDFLPFLSPEAMQGDEENAERTPLGTPLVPAVCPLHSDECPPQDHAEPPAPLD
ncbi:hypothetical protein M2271_007223 [Streptomyces sp. LBL]|uniref:hypothetical protein n=1 Tax=Streptomyces sp. LBL TaxID=2940562 RepID=UPI0024767BCE|nr:hypothetical protein [Streptomyces sp. LBL]MDH6629387.1 hypothetical protein [Streptomyces sp. LBL]